MTQEEHLNKIVAKCRELLAVAEDGFAMPTGYVGKNSTKGDHYRSGYFAGRAACAGPAEAGWRATIAACEMAALLHSVDAAKNEELTKAIIAAWPEELL